MKSLVAEMEAACKEIAAALAQLGVDMDAMYKDLKDTVVDLDTLRYRSLLASADGNVDILNDVWDGMDKMIEGLGMMLEGRWEVNRERRRVQAQPERQAYEHQWHDLNAAIRDGDEFHLRPGQL
jgi:dihydropteroate synthase